MPSWAHRPPSVTVCVAPAGISCGSAPGARSRARRFSPTQSRAILRSKRSRLNSDFRSQRAPCATTSTTTGTRRDRSAHHPRGARSTPPTGCASPGREAKSDRRVRYPPRMHAPSEDIYTEPDDVDPDTLANLGPLRAMAGVWESDGGIDEHPVAEGTEEDRYVERIELQPIDPQTNGPQLYYGLRNPTR